ncbi:PAS domain-containing protein [Pedobacter alpinus]|uniref:histidine kinase n=1 Tax=Pedobacter alpinus TaxID=1590643 RepID=A0ABW5TT24_9SPHI
MLNQEIAVLDYLFEQTIDLICLCKPDLTIVKINKNFAPVLNFEKEDLIGKNISELLPPTEECSLNKFLSSKTKLISGNQEFVCNLKNKDGSLTPILWHISEIEDLILLKGTKLLSNINHPIFSDDNLKIVTDNISDCFFVLDQSFQVLHSNKAAIAKFSHPLLKNNVNSFFGCFPEDTNNKFSAHFQSVLQTKQPIKFVEFSTLLNSWFSIGVMAFNNDLSVIASDISDRIIEYKTNELELKTFEMNIEKKCSTEEILFFLLTGFENLYPHLHTSILKIEDAKVWHFCSPNLPKQFCEDINGVDIGPNEASCGAAAFIKKTVITENLITDPNWERYNKLLIAENYKSCWSFPIISNKSYNVMATFAAYAKENRKPTEAEIKSIARICNIVKIIFEDLNYDNQLQLVNNRYKTATTVTNDAIYDWDLKLKKVYWSENTNNIFGYNAAEVDGLKNWWKNSIHPDDLEQTIQRLKGCFTEKKTGWAAEYRMRCKDGTYKYVYDRAYIIFNDKNDPITVIGAIQDISILKEREIEIIKQNNKLKEIAQISSHDLRRPVTSILGLISLFNTNNLADVNNNLVIDYLQKATKELDDVIHTIVAKTLEADYTIYDKHVKLRN